MGTENEPSHDLKIIPSPGDVKDLSIKAAILSKGSQAWICERRFALCDMLRTVAII